MDSSSAEVCSGEVPCLLGSWARVSFSTWILVRMRQMEKIYVDKGKRVAGVALSRRGETTYGDFEIH